MRNMTFSFVACGIDRSLQWSSCGASSKIQVGMHPLSHIGSLYRPWEPCTARKFLRNESSGNCCRMTTWYGKGHLFASFFTVNTYGWTMIICPNLKQVICLGVSGQSREALLIVLVCCIGCLCRDKCRLDPGRLRWQCHNRAREAVPFSSGARTAWC